MRVLLPLLALAACSTVEPQVGQSARAPSYDGIETRLLDGDLVNFQVALRGASDESAIERYAECAAAQYTLIRGYGFARHLRTTVSELNGVWTADAIYTISPDLPRGSRTLDAEVVVADCATSGIPTV